MLQYGHALWAAPHLHADVGEITRLEVQANSLAEVGDTAANRPRAMFKSLPSLPTFKSLPSAIGLPFLSTTEDAQLKFKSGEGGVKRLYGEEVIPVSDVGYWAQYYTLFNSAADVYSLISVQDVRQALTVQPRNLANLLHILSHHLFTLLPSPLFPTNQATASSSQQDPSKEALNCLRVLGKILVVVYEAEADARESGMSAAGGTVEETFGQKYLWARGQLGVDPSPGTGVDGGAGEGVEEEGQFTIADSDSEGDGDEGANAFKGSAGRPPTVSPLPAKLGDEKEKEVVDPLSQPAAPDEENTGREDEENKLPCLADRLFSCTVDLLFYAGFTVPDTVRGQGGVMEKINYVIWEKGVGSTVSIGGSVDLDRNKTEVLRFLIILLSTTIYTPPHALATSTNVPLEQLTHSLERRLVLSLLCSFLNTSLSSSKASSGVTGQLPYNHLISKAAEERRTLVRGCLMVLLVALDHRTEAGPEAGEGNDDNAFRYFVSKLHRKEDFAFILTGIIAIFEEHTAVSNSYLPGSKKPVAYMLETFMLLWRLVDLNKRFRQYIFDSGKANDVIGYVLLACLELKDDHSQHGLLRLLSYLLQTLSADQAFAEALNKAVRLTVPAKWAVSGTTADFMIVSIYSIATTPGLNPLFPALMISIANVAPYLKNIGVQASTRLLQLFKAFSAPNFLLADEGHPRLVYYLLETFNSVLYYQLNENPNLVYAVLRSHQDFQTLATFTLVSGLREIQRRKAMRAAADVKRKDQPKGLQRTNSELDMLAEKAGLLGRSEEDEEILDGNHAVKPTPPTSPTRDLSHATAQPLTTPGDLNGFPDPLSTAVAPPGFAESPSSPGLMSEKARGKMRAIEPSDTPGSPTMDEPEVPDEELMRVAAAGVGPNGYVPTQDWVASWQKGLPLDPVLVAISELLPRIQDTPPRGGAPSSKVFNMLKLASVGDVMPPAPPNIPRRFQWSPASCVWLTSLLWGDIYVAGLTSIGIWRDTTVRLFGVKQAPVKGRSAQVGRVLKMIGMV